MKLKATIRASLWYMAAMVTAIGALLVSSGIEHSANGWEMLGWAAAALVLLAAALAMLGLGCCADKESRKAGERRAEMRPPMNMTPEETEIWQRMEQHGEELVRDMGAALLQADRLPEWMKESAVNMLCDKLADARALAASWMNDRGEP